MKNHEMKAKESGKATFLLLGVGIGAVVSLLFAPRSGQDMRHVIREKTDKSRKALDRSSQRFSELARSAIDKSKQYIERGREALGGAVGANKQSYKDTRNEFNDHSHN